MEVYCWRRFSGGNLKASFMLLVVEIDFEVYCAADTLFWSFVEF